MNAMRSYTDVRIVLGLLALLWCFVPSLASGEAPSGHERWIGTLEGSEIEASGPGRWAVLRPVVKS